MSRWERLAELVPDKLMDVANYAFGALIVGQFVGGKPFSWIITVAGLGIWIFFYALASIIILSRR